MNELTTALRRTATASLLLLALAGCGPQPSSNAAPPPALAFSQCLRAHGVDAPDPDPSGTPVLDAKKAADPAVKKAVAACQESLPGGSVRPSATADDFARLTAFAACMRAHGLPDFPDPEPGASGAFAGSGADRKDPAFQSAAQACQPALSGSG